MDYSIKVAMAVIIQKATGHESKELFQLYRLVSLNTEGIIRIPEEITLEYVQDFISKSCKRGLILIAKQEGMIIGEIHAYTPKIYAFQHLLTDLTIVVHPQFQGMGIGKKLFNSFLKEVKDCYVHILRVELYTREHNKRNVHFYENLGFKNEGKQERKIFVGNLQFHTPIHMVWFNPNYGIK